MMLIGHELLHSTLRAQLDGKMPGWDTGKAMLLLARTFPTLEEFTPHQWDAVDFDEAVRRVGCAGAEHAARFVLEIYNSTVTWKLGRFSVVQAFHTWDEAHREAFRAWTRSPWWP